MDKFEEFYKEHCLDHFGYNPDLNWIFEKHEDGSYIQIEVENAKKVYQHQQAKVEELKASHHGEVIGHEVHFKKIKQERDELQTLYTQQGINMLKLQKRVDAVKGLIEDLNKCYQQDHQNKFEYWRGFADSAGILGKRLEQALKGEG
ncbi:hypothetical protein [Acinetobacter baumannii]|uniref:hypothetical protein n=1 Tax=Acinetobacter baumannii TaxID=470 RepID=UPI0018DC7B91|nr:hypothetical protein [Acinetobacter baumannii]MBH8359957.1 hypothetical protein [Acinetobacter baumannii]MBH8383262.1 hypothetical protein [Acinetobacter baumannii]MBH8481631.1 hypothetical protein [Acinetobacter baumannii]MDC4148162.1 hypothetical protein [Acinetobacter baumannii]